MTQSSQVMTINPVCCLGSDPISSVCQQMQIQDIGSIPVVTDHESKKLIGIVTDRDIALRVVGAGLETKNTLVVDVMTPNPVACHDFESVNTVLDAMALHRLRRIPIIDANGQLLGIISQADVATRLHNSLVTANMVEEISQPHSVILPREGKARV